MIWGNGASGFMCAGFVIRKIGVAAPITGSPGEAYRPHSIILEEEMDILEEIKKLDDKISDGFIDDLSDKSVRLEGTFSYEVLERLLGLMRPSS